MLRRALSQTFQVNQIYLRLVNNAVWNHYPNTVNKSATVSLQSLHCRLTVVGMTTSAQSKVVSYQYIKNLGKNVLLIDVREPAELQQTGVLPNSINIPLGKIEETFKNLSCQDFRKQYGCDKPDTSKPLIFSCKAGIRSAKAMKIIENMGYTNTSNYEGGYDDWQQQIKTATI